MALAAATERVSPTAERKILLVGASRGVGLGLAKSFATHGWTVVATERRASGGGVGLAAAVAAASGHIRAELVDIDDPQTVQKLRTQLSGERFDVIFIVAGIRDKDPTRPTHEVSVEEAVHVFVSNAYSPICFAETFFDLLKPRLMAREDFFQRVVVPLLLSQRPLLGAVGPPHLSHEKNPNADQH